MSGRRRTISPKNATFSKSTDKAGRENKKGQINGQIGFLLILQKCDLIKWNE